MRPLIYATSACALFVISGCSDPKAPSEANFRRALEPAVHDRFCRTLGAITMVARGDRAEGWPVLVPVRPYQSNDGEDADGRALLEQGVREGLLGRDVRTLTVKRSNYTESKTARAVISYTPTAKAAGTFRAVQRKTGSGMLPFPGVCAAEAEIVDFVRWTEPADAFGQTITRVTYRIRGTDVSALVPRDAQAGFEEPREETATLVKASDGWRRIE